MATLRFKTLEFKEHADHVQVIFHKRYSFDIPKAKLEKIGTYKLEQNAVHFDASEERAQRKFNNLIDEGFEQLYSLQNKRKTIYIHAHAGIPLIGTRYFGFVDKGSSMLDVKPLTGCNINCVFCSVDEGLSGKKPVDYLVEKDYLVQEIKKLLAFKQEKIDLYINPQGEPLLYPEIVDLIHDLAQLNINILTLITNGVLLTKQLIDDLINAGLNQINISLCATTPETAKKLSGLGTYNVAHVMDMAAYAAKKIPVILAPVYVPSINDDEIPKIIAFAKKIHAQVFIQNFLINPKGRNPVKPISFEQFKRKLKEWGQPTTLDPIKQTKELPKPFKKGDLIQAEIRCPGRALGEQIAVAKDRAIIVPNCTASGMIKLKITHSAHNIFYGAC